MAVREADIGSRPMGVAQVRKIINSRTSVLVSEVENLVRPDDGVAQTETVVPVPPSHHIVLGLKDSREQLIWVSGSHIAHVKPPVGVHEPVRVITRADSVP